MCGATPGPGRSNPARSTSTCAGSGPSSGTRGATSPRSRASATASRRTADMLADRIHRLRRRIAAKLTLTLLGFVAVTLLVAGLYLNHELERLAVEGLEARLAVAARLLHDDARTLLARGASLEESQAFVVQADRATGFRVTVITADGRVIAESEVALRDLPSIENHRGRPEVEAALA